MIEAFVAGLTLGFVGSLHCVGMCGPLVLSLPLGGKGNRPSWWRIVTYHLSRSWGYAMMGALVGLFGKGLQKSLPSHLHMDLAIMSGVLMLVVFLVLPRLHLQAPGKWWGNLQASLSKSELPAAPWILGTLNALLPCGLVYVALAMGLATSSPIESMFLMFSFGLGTSPALMTVVGLGRVFRPSPSLGKRLKTASVVVCSSLLILRGLGLGIPYLSPLPEALNLEKESSNPASCECHSLD